jgi:AcrR family transcriptional regulator
MTSLRERQKEKRYQSIITAALLLIQEKGYSATSIKEIAGRAEVGVGTVYNYFHTKADIIVELYKRDVTYNLNRGKEVIGSLKNNCKQTAVELLAAYAAGYYGERKKSLLREIYSVVMSEQALARKELLQLDNTMVDQLAGLLIEAHWHSHLKPGVNPQEAAYILFSLAMYDFIVFVTDDDMQFVELEETIKRHVNIIFEGLFCRRG